MKRVQRVHTAVKSTPPRSRQIFAKLSFHSPLLSVDRNCFNTFRVLQFKQCFHFVAITFFLDSFIRLNFYCVCVAVWQWRSLASTTMKRNKKKSLARIQFQLECRTFFSLFFSFTCYLNLYGKKLLWWKLCQKFTMDLNRFERFLWFSVSYSFGCVQFCLARTSNAIMWLPRNPLISYSSDFWKLNHNIEHIETGLFVFCAKRTNERCKHCKRVRTEHTKTEANKTQRKRNHS